MGKLHERYDELNTHLQACEERLKQWTVEVAIPVDKNVFDIEQVSFHKHNGVWRIHINRPGEDWKALCECQTQVRVWISMNCIRKLHDAIVKAAEKRLVDVDAAIADLTAFNTEIKARKEQPTHEI